MWQRNRADNSRLSLVAAVLGIIALTAFTGGAVASPTGEQVQGNGTGLAVGVNVTNPEPITAGEQVQFEATASPATENGTQTYSWDLGGDGRYDDADGRTAERGFHAPGTYTVSVRVSAGNATDTASETIRVHPGVRDPDLSVHILDPSAESPALVDASGGSVEISTMFELNSSYSELRALAVLQRVLGGGDARVVGDRVALSGARLEAVGKPPGSDRWHVRVRWTVWAPAADPGLANLTLVFDQPAACAAPFCHDPAGAVTATALDAVRYRSSSASPTPPETPNALPTASPSPTPTDTATPTSTTDSSTATVPASSDNTPPEIEDFTVSVSDRGRVLTVEVESSEPLGSAFATVSTGDGTERGNLRLIQEGEDTYDQTYRIPGDRTGTYHVTLESAQDLAVNAVPEPGRYNASVDLARANSTTSPTPTTTDEPVSTTAAPNQATSSTAAGPVETADAGGSTDQSTTADPNVAETIAPVADDPGETTSPARTTADGPGLTVLGALFALFASTAGLLARRSR